MDQMKIGRFIAEQRREKKLTQSELAEKLGITDRAISKWENGRSLPDASIMLELCSILGITVTDLLSGERVDMDNYNEQMEKRLIEMVREKEASDKRLLRLEILIGVLSVIVLFIPILVAAYVEMEDWLRVVLVFSGFIPAIAGFAVAMKLEQVAGYYECAKCGHKYVPELKTMYRSMHMGRTRYMKCPECKQKSWQKKVISKD